MAVSSRGWSLVVWIIIFTLLCFITTILRFVAMRRQKRSFRSDDWLVLFSLVCMLTLEGCTFWAIHNGLGAHTIELTPAQLTVQFKLQFAGNPTWTLSTVACKLAVLRFYLVVFTTPLFKKLVWATMAGCVVYCIVLVPIFFVACTPVWAAWHPELHATNCWPWKYHSISAVSFNMLLDLLIVFLPLPVVWKIKMPTRKKVAVSGMFSLGLVIVAVMLWRLITTAHPSSTPDYSYDLWTVALQALLELWLGLIATNLPTIAPLLPKLIPSKLKSYFNSSGSSKNPTPRALRTFGSAGPNPRKPKDFSRLTDFDTIDQGDMELVGNGHNGNGISMQREFEVSVESTGKENGAQATVASIV